MRSTVTVSETPFERTATAGNLDGTPADHQAKRLQGHRSGAGIQNHAAAFMPDTRFIIVCDVYTVSIL
jgi:hypothetical protein